MDVGHSNFWICRLFTFFFLFYSADNFRYFFRIKFRNNTIQDRNTTICKIPKLFQLHERCTHIDFYLGQCDIRK